MKVDQRHIDGVIDAENMVRKAALAVPPGDVGNALAEVLTDIVLHRQKCEEQR